MSDFLHRLAARARGVTPVAKPLLRLSFGASPRLTREPERDSSFARSMDEGATNDKDRLDTCFENAPSTSLRLDGRSAKSSASSAIRPKRSENDPETHLLPPSSNEFSHLAQSPSFGFPSQAGQGHNISSDTLPAVRLNQSGLVSQSTDDGPSGPGETLSITSSLDFGRGALDEVFHILPPYVSPARAALAGQIRMFGGPDSASEGTARRPLRESAFTATTVPRIEKPSASFNDAAEVREPSLGAPSVQITIGRVEVRAVFPPATPAPRSAPVQPRPSLTLEEYAKRRNRGER